MAKKKGNIRDYRREEAAGKSFDTDYYNQAIHEAALAQPEFMRKVLA